MTLASLIEKAHLLATGKGTAPASTTNKYARLLGLANICQDMWQNEPDVEWDSLYQIVTLAVTVTATDTFALGSSIREISNRPGDYIKITQADGVIKYYDLVRANQLLDYARDGIRVVARVGSNLVFSVPFTASDPEIGGSIKVPSYAYVSTLSDSADIIQVDNPLWLCYMVASEYCRTDTTLNYRTDDLLARANEVMRDMKQTQEAQVNTPVMSNFTLGRTW